MEIDRVKELKKREELEVEKLQEEKRMERSLPSRLRQEGRMRLLEAEAREQEAHNKWSPK